MSAGVKYYDPVSRPAGPTPVDFFRPGGAFAAHVFWIGAVCTAPLFFGGVSIGAQAFAGLFAASSLCFACTRVELAPRSRVARAALGLLAGLFVLQLVPLPVGIARVLSPEAVRLHSELNDGGGFIPLSISPGGSITRLVQLATLAGCAVLARQGAKVHGFAAVFCWSIAGTMILLGASELWRMADGRGPWTTVQNYPTGTFANRNHYANWMAAGSMLLMGAIARELRMPRTALSRWSMAVYGAALVLAIGTIVACGSRGGMLAMTAGCAVWLLFAGRGQAWKRGLLVLAFGGAIGVLAFAWKGELLMGRLAGGGLEFKMRIWEDSFALWQKFPLMGVGLGAFEPAFSVHKTFHGEGTFLHAENDWIEWLLETGVAGLILGSVLLACVLHSLLGRAEGSTRHPEIFCGAVAGLAAFAVHACFEFVAYVPATALLAAALLGLAAGLKERSLAPVVARLPGVPSILFALVAAVGLAIVALFQGLGWLKYREGIRHPSRFERATLLAEASRTWPFSIDFAIAAGRAEFNGGLSGGPDGEQALAILERAARWHPFDWELRLERALAMLACNPRSETALAEARLVGRLNPLQAGIPLKFAGTLAAVNPLQAIEFLRLAALKRPDDIREALRIAWKVNPDPAALWEVVPVTAAGLETLAAFAREHQLQGLSDEASERLEALNGLHR